MKQVVSATLVKLGDTGVGVAQIEPISQKSGGQFVYFKPRDLDGYRGETWSELALQGLRPGRLLQIELDRDLSGEIRNVSGVRLASR